MKGAQQFFGHEMHSLATVYLNFFHFAKHQTLLLPPAFFYYPSAAEVMQFPDLNLDMIQQKMKSPQITGNTCIYLILCMYWIDSTRLYSGQGFWFIRCCLYSAIHVPNVP